jgi:hypothetical protein
LNRVLIISKPKRKKEIKQEIVKETRQGCKVQIEKPERKPLFEKARHR